MLHSKIACIAYVLGLFCFVGTTNMYNDRSFCLANIFPVLLQTLQHPRPRNVLQCCPREPMRHYHRRDASTCLNRFERMFTHFRAIPDASV